MEVITILTCKLGNEVINCYDGTHNKEQLKKWANKKILLCPVCGKPYEYCHGQVKTPYFRHMEKSECEDLYSESETEEHLNGKRDLFEWVKIQNGVTNAVLEGWIPETKQRPDIMFEYYGKKYVIEYQCTPISSEYFERHDLYLASGITDIWILGWEKYKKSFSERIKYSHTRHKTIEEYSSAYYCPFDNKIAYTDFSDVHKFLKSIKHDMSNALDSCVITKNGIIDCNFRETDFNVVTKKRNVRKLNIVTKKEKQKYLKLQHDINAIKTTNYLYSLNNNSWNFYFTKYSKSVEFMVVLVLNNNDSYNSYFRNEVKFPDEILNYKDKTHINELLLPLMKKCIEDAKIGNSEYRLMEVR